MNYQEFLTTVKTQLSLRIDSDVTLDIRSFPRNNGTHYDGLIMLQPSRNVSPTIYLTPYYHRYLEGVCLEDIYDDIIKTYQTHLPGEDFDTSLFTDYSKAASRIVMRLISHKHNEEQLKKVPHFHYHDLAIVFYCMLHADDKNQANILIYNEHLSMWGITEDELYHTARKNTQRLLPSQMISMRSLIPDAPDDLDVSLYILSNQYRTNGATVILYDGLLSRIAERFQKDLVILPSSIHETLLLPVDSLDSADMERYAQMIQEVNETQLADEEILSDHAYYYSRSTGLVTM
jgi:hypothetical protein